MGGGGASRRGAGGGHACMARLSGSCRGDVGAVWRRRGGGAGCLDGARHEQPDQQHVAVGQRRQLHVVGVGEDCGLGADADAGTATRAAPELAGFAGGPGAVHEGVLAGAAVAPVKVTGDED